MKPKIRITLVAICLFLALWMGAAMYQRASQELLWGYRPLLLLSSVWAFIILLLSPRFSRLPNTYSLLGASSLSSLLLALGFPDLIPMPLLMFVGFVPLLWVEDQIAKAKGSRWDVFKFSYHTFVLWNILTTYWVANTSLPAGLFAILVNSGLMCIPFLLYHEVKKSMPNLSFLALIVFWITFEYNHLNWDLTWPWLTLGNSFAEYPSLVQWYEYTGVFGGSLWILLTNALIFKALQKNGWKKEWKPLLRPALLILAPIALSLIRYYQYEETGKTIEVAVIQPNYEPHYEKFETSEEEQMNRFIELTLESTDENTDYILYPETSFGLVQTNQMNAYPAIRRLQAVLSRYPRVKLVTGFDGYHVFQAEEEHSKAVRKGTGQNGATFFYEIINGAIQLSSGTKNIPLYKKSKLVPGPEIFPFKKTFFFFEPLVKSLGGTTAGLATQPERAVFKSETARIGPAICYESVFGEYYNGYIKKGAQAIFIMTNDGWWDNTAGHRQHLRFASLRAIETRRSIARSANTGVSAFINQRGDISQPTRYGEATTIKGAIHLNDSITFYVRWGDVIARLSLFSAIILMLNIIVKRLRNGRLIKHRRLTK